MIQRGIINRSCELCGELATDRHHKFSQSKVAKKLYPDYIHDPRNLVYLCNSCHLTKPIPKYSEREFCEIMGIKTRSKSGLL